MSLTNDLKLYIDKNDNKNIDSLIKVLLISYDENNFSQQSFDKNLINDAINFIKNNDKEKIIVDLLSSCNIIGKEYLNIFLENKNFINILIKNIIEHATKTKSNNFSREIIKFALINGLKTNKNTFLNYIYNDEYHSMFKLFCSNYSDIFTLCTTDIINLIKQNQNDYSYKKNEQKKQNIISLYSLFFKHKINKNLFDCILSSNDKYMIAEIFNNSTISNDFTIDHNYFEIMCNLELFPTICKFANENRITNLKECYNLFLTEIQKKPYNSYSYTIFTFNQNITTTISGEKKHVQDIFIYFINKGFFEQGIFDLLFAKKLFDYIVLLRSKGYHPDTSNFVSFLNHSQIDNLNYFEDIQFTEEHLYVACVNMKENIIREILNQKIKPTKRCLTGLYEKFPGHTLIPKIIEYLIYYGYILEESDLLLTLKYGTKINENLIQKVFNINDELKLKIYDFCKFDFMPQYSENMYNDIYWLRRMCKIARRTEDYKIIKNYIKKYKFNIDGLCYIYMNMNYGYNKEKTELLESYVPVS